MNATRAEIVGLLREGLSNKAIAKHLHIPHSTVGEIRRDLGLPNVTPRNAQCGTDRGAERHQRRDEPLCDPCRHAHDQAADERPTERGTDMAALLTPTEQRLFTALEAGATEHDIAREFACSVRNVRRHIASLCTKLGVTRDDLDLINRWDADSWAPGLSEPAPADGMAVPLTDPGPGVDWRHRAACREGSGIDAELFFPIGNTGPALIQLEEAKAVCRTCPVMEECLRWALDTRQDAGVWGCTSEDERRAMHRRRARNRSRTA